MARRGSAIDRGGVVRPTASAVGGRRWRGYLVAVGFALLVSAAAVQPGAVDTATDCQPLSPPEVGGEVHPICVVRSESSGVVVLPPRPATPGLTLAVHGRGDALGPLLTWAAPEGAVASGIDVRYRVSVERLNDGVLVVRDSTEARSFAIDTPLAAGAYQIRVMLVDGAGRVFASGDRVWIVEG